MTDAPTDLTQRQVIDVLFRERAARAYTFAALGGLAMTFVVMFMNGSDIGGVLVVLLGAAALVFRWTSVPPLLVLVVSYFQLFPFGLPDLDLAPQADVRTAHFIVADMVLVMAVLVYLRAQYRLFGLVHQIVPFENALRRKGDAPTRRPVAHVRPDEIAWLAGIAAGLVLVGQGAWWLANTLEFVPLADGFPLRWAEAKSPFEYRRPPPGEFRPGQNRFFVIAGALFFGTLLARGVFGYWRLRAMSAAEGAMVLADTSWAESHRERVRVEKWRVWGRDREKRKARDEQG